MPWPNTSSLRSELIRRLGGKCACCLESFEDFLTIDHIYNDGHLMGQGSSRRYYKIKRELDRGTQHRYQVLCANCHAAKTWREGCSHPGHKGTLSL